MAICIGLPDPDVGERRDINSRIDGSGTPVWLFVNFRIRLLQCRDIGKSKIGPWHLFCRVRIAASEVAGVRNNQGF